MLLHLLPNSEVELTFDATERTQRKDRPKPHRSLDIRLPVPTKRQSRLERRDVAGFGRLHRGLGTCRRGTRRRVQRLGGVIDELHEDLGLERVFITLTCPGSSRRAVEAFSAWTGYILNGLNDWLYRKQVRAFGVQEFYRLHVWELQKRGAEHVHYVCLLSPSVEEKVKKELREWYLRVLGRVSRLSGVDIFEREDGRGSWKDRPEVLQIKVERVVQSVSAYLSKYLNKTMHPRGRFSSMKSIARPARLWGASRCLKGALNRCTISRYFRVPKGEIAPSLCRIVESLEQQHSKFSLQISRTGQMGRLRCFFGGNKQSQKQCFDEVAKELEIVSVPIGKGGLRVEPGAATLRKASRIIASSKKKVAFHDLYGKEIYQAMLTWVEGGRPGRRMASLLFRALEDFDEISMTSLGLLSPRKGKKELTLDEVQGRLFP